MKSTIILAFDQHAATTVAAVLLPGAADVGAALADVGQRDDRAVRRAGAPSRRGVLLLRSGPVWL